MAIKGIKQSKEHKENRLKAIREFYKKNPNHNSGKNNGMYGKKHKPESIEKNRNYHLGKIPWNKNKPFKHKGSFKKGHKFVGTGKSWFTTERVKGEKNINWAGGISFNPYPKNWTKKLKKLIKERDNYKCFICKKYGKHCHHINYDKNDCRPENLITLCSSCHSKTNRNRNYWRIFFNGKSV